MNPRHPVPTANIGADVLEARFGFRVASMLSEHTERLPHDVGERLKFARQQALEQRRKARASAPAVAEGSVRLGRTLSLFGGSGQRWIPWMSALPLLALVAGLFLIQYEHGLAQIEVAADVDAALLGDDLPPAAYRDAGFVEYLKTPRQ